MQNSVNIDWMYSYIWGTLWNLILKSCYLEKQLKTQSTKKPLQRKL